MTKKINLLLIIMVLMVPDISSAVSNLYQQPFLSKENYKKLSPQQKAKEKLAYFESQVIMPLRNKVIAYSVVTGIWAIAMNIVSRSFVECGAYAEWNKILSPIPHPFRVLKEINLLNEEAELLCNLIVAEDPSCAKYSSRNVEIEVEIEQKLKKVKKLWGEMYNEIGRSMEIIALGVATAIVVIPVAYVSYKVLKNTYNAWTDYWNRVPHPVESLEKKYILIKEYLPNKLKSKLEELFLLARFDSSEISTAQDFAKVAVNIPLENLNIAYSENELKLLLEGYPPELQAKMNAFAFRQMMIQSPAKNPPSLENFRKGKRNAAYFHGIPGSGKTRFAQLTAEALHLPFAVVSLEGASISDIVGRSTETNEPTPGLILQALTNATVDGKTAKNAVLFLDEADRVINNSQSEVLPFLLKLLDPETKSFFSPYLGTTVDISNLIIILAGNHKIQDEALAKRLQIIQFNGFPVEYKKQIIWETTLNKMCESYSTNGEYTISLADFTDQEREEINRLIALDTDPGFRAIESLLMDYIDYKAMKKHGFKLIIRPLFEEKLKELNTEYQKK